MVVGAGGDRDTGKRPLMGANAAERADLLIVTDDNPRSEDPAAIRAELLVGRAGRPGTPTGGRDRRPAGGDQDGGRARPAPATRW